MHPQLQLIFDEFQAAADRFERLLDAVPLDRWSTRPDPVRWSVGECIAHLNLTAVAVLPRLVDGVARARLLDRTATGASAGRPPRRYGRDPLGWFLWQTMAPPVRLRVSTSPDFVPQGDDSPETLRAEFRRLQTDQIECLRAADGLPIDRVTIESPFNSRVHYNLYAAFSILPRHQLRHLWQAEQAWAGRGP